jgi:hypothetical protein
MLFFTAEKRERRVLSRRFLGMFYLSHKVHKEAQRITAQNNLNKKDFVYFVENKKSVQICII